MAIIARAIRLQNLINFSPLMCSKMLNVNAVHSLNNKNSACFNSHSQQRNFQMGPTSRGIFGPPQDETFFKRVAKKFGWTETSRSILKAWGYLMYIKVADEVNYKNFFSHCQMEDTFVSWFSVMELHVWMLSARLMQEGEEGRIVRNALLQAMWEDCDAKTKKLEGALASARKKQIKILGDQFQATFVSYDEGLLSDDIVLAGALWRRFLTDFDNSPKPTQDSLHKDAIALEMLVMYVRSQFHNLNELGKMKIFKRKFDWDPFDEKLIQSVDKIAERRIRKKSDPKPRNLVAEFLTFSMRSFFNNSSIALH